MTKGRVWETFKSALLTVLVLCSFLLTAGIWRDQADTTGASTQGYVAPGSTGHPDLKSLLSPGIVVHVHGKHYIVSDRQVQAFNRLWEAALKTLGGGEADLLERPVPVDDMELVKLRGNGSGIEINLPLEMTLRQIFSLWGGADQSQIARSTVGAVAVQRVVLFLDGPDRTVVYLGGSQGRMRAVVSGGNLIASALEGIEGEGVEARMLSGAWQDVKVAAGIFVPRSLPYVEHLGAEPESLDGQGLADAIFPDPGFVRRIDNVDGSTLYTDGLAAVRLSKGTIEYSRPEPSNEEGRDQWAGFKTAEGFIAQSGGYPPATRLSAGSASRVEFTYLRNGLPVFVKPQTRGLQGVVERVSAPLSVQIAGSDIVSYYRSVWRPAEWMGLVQLMPAEDAITELDKVLEKSPDFEDLRRPVLIRNVYPAYVLSPNGALASNGPSGTLEPVWVLESTSGKLFAVRAASQSTPGGEGR